jgi:type I restriction enzyme M protein
LELKELTEKTMKLFNVSDLSALGEHLMQACDDESVLGAFTDLVNGDLSQDWLQKIYQYYLADRKEKKQDYTPASLAYLLGALAGDSEKIVDMCAGSGALIIQKWNQDPTAKFTAIEIDENVIPFLIFNMVLRNICCKIYLMDALVDDKPSRIWQIVKGDKFGRIINHSPAIQPQVETSGANRIYPAIYGMADTAGSKCKLCFYFVGIASGG